MQRTLLTHIEAEYLRYKTLGEGALRQLRAEEMVMHAAGANSVAVIVWHLAGNLESRFTDFLTSDGEKPWRHRDSEFEPRQATPASIRKKWDRGWRLLLASLRELSDDDLGRSVTIRGIALRVDEALLRSLAHVAYHVGQIVYVAKSRRGDAWQSLTIPPGRSEEYRTDPPLARDARRATKPANP
ncbi:MAG: DUF1572 family protein [Acidobacteria bacterium]|nr:DUF1572 family protein [Acidobacteriota bacterium]